MTRQIYITLRAHVMICWRWQLIQKLCRRSLFEAFVADRISKSTCQHLLTKATDAFISTLHTNLYICIVRACVTLSYIEHVSRVSFLFALVGLKITCHYLLTAATDPDRNCADVGHSQPHWRRMRRKYLRRSFSRFWEHACLAFSLCFQMQVPSKTGNVKTLWGTVNLCRMRRRSQQIFFKICFLGFWWD